MTPGGSGGQPGLDRATIADLAAALAAGTLTSAELTAFCAARIERHRQPDPT